MGKHYRFVGRNNTDDRTQSVLVEQATAEKPEKRLQYDPNGVYDAVELSDEQADSVRQHVVLKEVKKGEQAGSQSSPDPAVQSAGTDPDLTPYTEEQLNEMSASDVEKLAKDRGVEGSNKEDRVKAILAKQEGGE